MEGWSSRLKAASWATDCSWERGDSGVGGVGDSRVRGRTGSGGRAGGGRWRSRCRCHPRTARVCAVPVSFVKVIPVWSNGFAVAMMVIPTANHRARDRFEALPDEEVRVRGARICAFANAIGNVPDGLRHGRVGKRVRRRRGRLWEGRDTTGSARFRWRRRCATEPFRCGQKARRRAMGALGQQ